VVVQQKKEHKGEMSTLRAEYKKISLIKKIKNVDTYAFQERLETGKDLPPARNEECQNKTNIKMIKKIKIKIQL
jgi:hypothetical protein